jgi:hypothetical protein
MQPQNSNQFTVLESDASGTIIQFSTPAITPVKELSAGKEIKRIECESTGRAAIPGVEDVPIFSSLIAIPNTGKVELEVLERKTYSISNPFKTSNRVDSEFEANDLITDKALELGKLSEPVIIRDIRAVSLTISPIKYDSDKDELEIASEVTFRIKNTDVRGENELEYTPEISSAFIPLYRSLFANVDEIIDRSQIRKKQRLLIIYGGSTDAAYVTAIENFITWKKQKGYLVTSTSTSDIGSTTANVKAYIQTKYNNLYTRPDYVLLIGDVTGSLSIGCYSVGGGDSDYPYTQLAGNDTLGDVFIGRIPAENVTQFLTMANKVYTYERDLVTAQPAWYNQMLLVGDTQPSGQSCVMVNKYLKEVSYDVNPQYTYNEIYSGQPSPNDIDVAINAGVAIYNYRGYINMSDWDMPVESHFSNANKLPHCILNTCATGNFAGTDVTDAFVRFGTPALPKGGLTAIGMATSSTHTLLNNLLTSGTIEGIFQYGMRDMSSPHLRARLLLWYVYNDLLPTKSVDFPSWCNLMGDPTVEVFIGVPQTLTVQYQTTVTEDQGSFLVSVKDADNNPVEGAVATILWDNTQDVQFTDINGNAIFVLNSNLTTGDSMTLTVSKHDHKPEIRTVNVVSIPQLSLNQIMTDDSTIGNNNGIVNAGEQVEILLELTNNYMTSTNGLTFNLTTDDPYITIINGSAQYGEIAMGSSGVSSTPYTIQIDPNTPVDYKAVLCLEYTSGILPFDLEIANGEIEVEGYQFFDANGILEPGESTYMSLSLVNTGGSVLAGINVKLSSDSPLVYFGDDNANFGNAQPGSTVTNLTDGLQIIARDNLLTGQTIPIKVSITNQNGFSAETYFTISSGDPTINHPTGPDQFGHYIYHNADTSWPDAPVYDWVEIAPNLGGNGIIIPMTDTDADDDNSDWVGITSLGTRDLPFTFTYYGIDYDEFTVCSNGFLTFGQTEISSCRNLPIPGPMTPNPVIAPFWDNLEIHSDGGIYFWHDEQNSQLIIEWYNVINSYTGSTRETFQVILYDPEVYPTSTGDGMIKLQYQTFNDVDAGDAVSYTPGHGQYSTIGFGDHTGTDGISYLFDLDYASTSQPIANNTAILFTGEPYVNTAPVIEIYDLHYSESNGNGFIEPGETVNFGIEFTNSGMTDATSITATISSTNQYVSIINGSVDDITIPAGESFVSDDSFQIQVSASAPYGEELLFNVSLTDVDNSLLQEVSLYVLAPQLEVIHVYLCDSESGNGNGVPDSPEQLYIAATAVNYGVVDLTDVSTSLTCSNPGVVIGDYPDNLPVVPALKCIQTWYPVSIPSGLAMDTTLDFTITYEDADSFVTTYPFFLTIGDDNDISQVGLIDGTISAQSGDPDLSMTFVADNSILTTVSDTGEYKMFLHGYTSGLVVTLDHYIPSTTGEYFVMPGSFIHHDVDVVLEPLPVPNALVGDYLYPTFSLEWEEPDDCDYDVIGYNVFKKQNDGEYQFMLNTTVREFTDNITDNGVYYYYVEAEYEVGTSFPSAEFVQSVTANEGDTPTVYVTELTGNYPNPFNPLTNISYSLAREQKVTISVFNVRGQHVKTLVNEVRPAGRHVVQWNGKDDLNNNCASGFYLYRFETKDNTSIRKALLLK